MADCAVWITVSPTALSGLPGGRLCCMDYMATDCAVWITWRPTVLYGFHGGQLCCLNAGHGGPANVPAGSELIVVTLEVWQHLRAGGGRLSH